MREFTLLTREALHERKVESRKVKNAQDLQDCNYTSKNWFSYDNENIFLGREPMKGKEVNIRMYENKLGLIDSYAKKARTLVKDLQLRSSKWWKSRPSECLWYDRLLCFRRK